MASWDSKYISEGRNNLEEGGIAWAVAAVTLDQLTVFAAAGRGDQAYYIEYDVGLEYSLEFHENVDAVIGYQRIETYGDDRASDNELFATVAYSGWQWLVPELSYTFSTEAGGYFIEAALYNPWQVSDTFHLTSYVKQAFDFQYVTEEFDGANHFQLGVEANYQLTPTVAIGGHVSHTIAMKDIKEEVGSSHGLNQTYAGVNISLSF